MIKIGIFAKPPVAGTVKTRLIPDIGAEKATSVYRYCLQHTLDEARRSGLDYELFLTEESNDPIFQHEACRLQKGADLGERMLRSLEQMLRDGADGAIIIGSDCLDLDSLHLQAAARALADHEMVLLPAFDGGYALIGCSRVTHSQFNGVQWSGAQVYRKTVANAKKLGYRVCSLETVRDIDTLGDLDDYPELVRLATER